MSTIDIDKITKTFAGHFAVRDVSFTVGKGDLTVLLGPSGCGKSTTLRLIAGLEEPTSGRIEIAGRDVTRLPAAERRIAMVFQSYALFPHLTVAENIIFGLRVRKVARAERDGRLKSVAELVELAPYLDRKPGQLSGGQRQRVALARAIIAEQPVCLMDEPLSNLDAQLRHEMRVEIRALQQRLGMTMVYVTHDQTEAMTMADQVVLMQGGVIEQVGPPDVLYERPRTTFAARFIGAPPMNLMPNGMGGCASLMLGVRPEHVRLVAADSACTDSSARCRDAFVTSIEYLGADTVVTARIDGGTDLVAARVSGHARVRTGEKIGLLWNISHEHAFDARSGLRPAE